MGFSTYCSCDRCHAVSGRLSPGAVLRQDVPSGWEKIEEHKVPKTLCPVCNDVYKEAYDRTERIWFEFWSMGVDPPTAVDDEPVGDLNDE